MNFRLTALAALFAMQQAAAADLTVAVAANLQYAFEALARDFTQRTGLTVEPSYNSSGKFAAQIQNGAPFDVFLSADREFPDRLAASGQAAGAPRVYARGVLVLWTAGDADLSDWLKLLREGTGKVAIANPDTAPYGREAVNLLRHYRLLERVKPRLVYGESIGQTTQFIESRAAEAGFTAKSLVLGPTLQGKGRWVELPAGSYRPIAQAVMITRYGATHAPTQARKFVDYLFTPAAQAVFARFGYLKP
ncbi:molybdate ABC transporter substrate-binding protein [Gulbenkiania mobilis]|uniref:molybdate ABC transporter substrate-binding protein n=1 Tax=Gulbenkiania mobilis TaxID=397457 RepID=UPI0009F95DE3|nr:molybdate ABC transporter substrate-binding protein [Gulbenkiania mobilis]